MEAGKGTPHTAAAASMPSTASAPGGGTAEPRRPMDAEAVAREVDPVQNAGVDERVERGDAGAVRAQADYGHLDSHFDYEKVGAWLKQRCRQPLSEACGAFMARAVELLLRDTIDSVLEIARVRLNPPKTEDFAGTGLAVLPSGADMRERLAAMKRSQAAQAQQSHTGAGASSDDRDWGELADQNKAVISSIAMIDRKRKASTADADEAKRQRLAAAAADLGRAEAGAASAALTRRVVPGVPSASAELVDVLQHCRRDPQLHKSPRLNKHYAKIGARR